MQEIKRTIWLALPLIAGQLGQVMYGVIDNAMVGRLGALDLAAAAFTNAVTALPMMFMVGVSSSVSVLVAQSFGAGKKTECRTYLTGGLFVLLTIMATLILAFVLGPDFLPWFGQPSEVLERSRSYFVLVAWSMVPMVVFQGCRQFAVGLEQASFPTYILIAGLGINAFLNYVFIFGNFGAPALGLMGAGVATLASRTLAMLAILCWIFSSTRLRPYRPKHILEKPTRRQVRSILKIGLTSGVQYLFEVGAFAGAGIMAGWVGTEALAAHQISMNVGSITFMFAWGVSFAVSVRVGQALGENNFQMARTRGFAGLGLICVFMFSCGVFLILARNWIPSLYIDNPRVEEISARLLIICGLFQLFDGAQTVIVGALRGMSDVKIPTIATLFVYWGLCIPACYLLAFPFGYGVEGLWIGLFIGVFAASVALTWRFHILTARAEVT